MESRMNLSGILAKIEKIRHNIRQRCQGSGEYQFGERDMKQSIRMRANAVLLLTAIIWGVAFVA